MKQMKAKNVTIVLIPTKKFTNPVRRNQNCGVATTHAFNF